MRTYERDETLFTWIVLSLVWASMAYLASLAYTVWG